MTGAISERIVQVHLNRFCNLACAHCYSRSGPRERELLDHATVRRLLFEAKDQGYQVVSFSGGEPFLYPWFKEVLEDARDAGLSRIGVTNATVLQGRRIDALPMLDFIAVSVDGPEQIHNAIRCSPTAFARMEIGLVRIKESGVPFGIAHTVTQASLPHLEWVADLAHRHGARALQLHPLGLVGAADGSLPGLDGETLARTYLAALALRQQFGEQMLIHVDLFNVERLRGNSRLVVPDVPNEDAPFLLSDVINPLVVMSNGQLSPICHAMGDQYRLGEVSRGLATITGQCRDTLLKLHSLCSRLLDEVLQNRNGWPYLNWYELLEIRSMIGAAQSNDNAVGTGSDWPLSPGRGPVVTAAQLPH